jgi:CcmD family protein
MININYLIVAYMLIWFIVFFYLIKLSNNTKQLKKELENLKKELNIDD